MREKVRDLVQLGRLELVNGGYVQFDEATTTYEDMLVNFMKGSVFIAREFDIYPRIGWQLDSFGHSNRMLHESNATSKFSKFKLFTQFFTCLYLLSVHHRSHG